METAFNFFLWGMAGALLLVVPGALFGGAARTAAFLRQEACETTLKAAVLHGALQGGLFVAGFGFLGGLAIGWQTDSFEEGSRSLLLLAGATGFLMCGAIALAGTACFWTWLGQRFLGLLLSIAISGSLLAVVAWKYGLPRETAALGALAVVVLATAGVTVARLLLPREERPSPAEVAEELWLDCQNRRMEDMREQPPSDDRFQPRD